MERKEIFDAVVEILKKHYASEMKEDVTEETAFYDLYLDSLDIVELSEFVEQKFKIKTDINAWFVVETIGDVVNIIQEQVK